MLLTAVGGILVAMACWAPGPTDMQDEDAELPVVEAPPPADQSVSLGEADVAQGEEGTPSFTPFTEAPELKNRAEVISALAEEYPPLLRDAGISGTVDVWFYLDETGQVLRTQIDNSSDHEALDEAALRVADIIEFTPALNQEKRVPVWISLPIRFQTSDGAPSPAQTAESEANVYRVTVSSENPEESDRFYKEELPPPPEAGGGDITAAPTFTPFTIAPDIRNRRQVTEALRDNYPPNFRDAGIGATIDVWFLLDEQGVVQKALINKSSGFDEMDDAALEVAWEIEFTPALNRDKRVPVWISLPITFTTR